MCSFGKIISVQRTVPDQLTATPTYVEWNTILKTMTEVNGHLTKTITSTLISGQELRSTKWVANLPEISVFAPLIQMMHQPTSSPNTSSDTETATATGIETGMTTGITTESHSTLSTRAKTGIGFGVGMFVLVVIGISLFFFNRRRRKTQPAEPTQEDSYVSPHDESFEQSKSGITSERRGGYDEPSKGRKCHSRAAWVIDVLWIPQKQGSTLSISGIRQQTPQYCLSFRASHCFMNPVAFQE